MRALGNLAIIFSSFLGLLSLWTIIKIIYKLWWRPTRVQKLMRSRGIKGPSYRFIHGNTKEILIMKNKAMEKPMSLSHNIFSRVQPHIDSWIKIYGKNYLQWYGTEAQLVVTEPELIKEILNNKGEAFPKFEIHPVLKKIIGDGLVSSVGEKWARHRKLSNHAFHGESLKGMSSAMITSVEIMLERWKSCEGKEIEVYEEFRLLTSDVISRTAFGNDYERGQNIFEMLVRLVELVSDNIYKLRFPGISKFFKTDYEIELDIIDSKVRSNIIEMIKEKERKMMTGKEDNSGSDFLGLLLKAHHDADDSQRISINTIIDECKTFYFAGQETTNSLLAWVVLLLAIHTDWQEELRKEVLTLFGKQNPNPDSFAKLKKMGMVLNETLRLYPPAITLKRKVEREVRVGEYILPGNLNLFISALPVHHDPEIWGEDVHEFKPERFSEGVAGATKNNPAAFFPFGIGPRNCVGSNFAILESKLALCMMLQRYSFTLSPTYVHMPYHLITTRPRHGIQVILQPL
ncbi:cytochrome P450 CYP749A22-like [Ziziphus jujuba]|uniref:Cytochrome P450 CYP749A22-like n=1 Tax=Ziziphus jujuba TaxID=326968 RepID=A0ABM3I1Y3_ZIZJJ|nr:cytochrome P450 CYP749A22-like [Ziziphus jujuba]